MYTGDDLDWDARRLTMQAIRGAVFRESVLLRLLPDKQDREEAGWGELLVQAFFDPLPQQSESMADRIAVSHVLVSAQACFLPIPKEGVAEFNPVLFNYQSRAGDPAVLAILATREGTSITVIDNQRDRFEAGRTWGQRLFFNQNGERASLTGRRKSDFLADAREQDSTTAGSSTDESGRSFGAANRVIGLMRCSSQYLDLWPDSCCHGRGKSHSDIAILDNTVSK